MSNLVTCEWLANQLSSKNEKLIILDVTWFSNKDGQQTYIQQHIPTAQHFDIMDGAELSSLYPRNLPASETFQQNARAVGVNNDTHVVVYSDTDKLGFMTSGRAWWMFKYFGHENVSILDGGWKKWSEQGYPVTSEVQPIQEGTFTVNQENNYRRSVEEMKTNIRETKDQVIDSRDSTQYCTAHIPGAKNLSAESLLDKEKGVLKEPNELLELFQQAGIDLKQPCVSYCNSGMSSCTVAMAASLCGAKDWGVYTAGFTEWKNKCPEDDIEHVSSG